MKPKGRVEINTEWCKGCQLCIPACKSGVLGLSDELNEKGVRYAVALYPENCTGCTLCAINCPEIVIKVFREKKKK